MIYLISPPREKPEMVLNVIKDYAIDTVLDLEGKNTGDWKKIEKKVIYKELDSESTATKFIKEKYGNSRILVISKKYDFLEGLVHRGYPLAIINESGDYLMENYAFDKIPVSFFRRDAKDVAIELLGKLMVRKIDDTYLAGKIVETEAYYGENDPASRAKKGKKSYNAAMWLPGGHVFVYMVHANWMFNITTDGENAEAILIRAVEPVAGIHIMKKNRNKEIKNLCNGPGKWTRAFGIQKEDNGILLGDRIFVANLPKFNFEIETSGRIGVREDMNEDLRFYIRGSKFVSRYI